MTKRYPTALTIAGSDSGGCAGIQADIKTISSIGVFATSVITALTAQNTCEVRRVDIVDSAMVRMQLEAVLDDIHVDAVKTGMLPSGEIIETVADAIRRYGLHNVVTDPVMVATSGAKLASNDITDSFRKYLYPLISVLTPNIPEAEALSGIDIATESGMCKAASILHTEGCNAVLIKGGHLDGAQSVDMLFVRGREPLRFVAGHVDTRNLHGTGCTLSSAMAAYMSLGYGLEESVGSAKRYITSAIQNGADTVTGHGFGPVNHFHAPQPLKKTEI